MDWEKAAQSVIPYIFKIETPQTMGTGFLCLYNKAKTILGIATAHHVIDYAMKWKQPIKLFHHETNKSLFLKELEYLIFSDWETDSAVILFKKPKFKLPTKLIELLPLGSPLVFGGEVGWLGFPTIEPFTLCFFNGNISAWQDDRRAYLIDGVAINGVSGGPVMYIRDETHLQIVGIISAYRASRVTGETLPGLLYAQDVSHFHEVTAQIRSLEDAKKKKEEFEKEKKAPPPKKNNS